MKTYRPARELLAAIEETLAAKYQAGAHPLARVVESLYDGRHYGRLELVLDLNQVRERRYEIGEDPATARSEIREPLKLASLRLGELVAKDERAHAFGAGDRVLLKEVAARLALFLATKGKYIGFAARLQTAGKPQAGPALGAAAGEKSHR